MGWRLGFATACLLAACTVTPPPEPPSGLDKLSVAPIENKTGSPLVIVGDTYVERFIGRQKRTVVDEIARELTTTLRAQGFTIASGSVPRLTIVLRTFEPDQPQLSYVTVTLTAKVTDPDGTVRWTGDRTNWLVPTTGSPSLAAAYETASREVARGILNGWTPAH
jgi:hypothetical protein